LPNHAINDMAATTAATSARPRPLIGSMRRFYAQPSNQTQMTTYTMPRPMATAATPHSSEPGLCGRSDLQGSGASFFMNATHAARCAARHDPAPTPTQRAGRRVLHAAGVERRPRTALFVLSDLNVVSPWRCIPGDSCRNAGPSHPGLSGGYCAGKLASPLTASVAARILPPPSRPAARPRHPRGTR
jgi:hypothetical protein